MSWELCYRCKEKGYQNVHRLRYYDQWYTEFHSGWLCRKHRTDVRAELAARGCKNIQTLHDPADPKRPGLTPKSSIATSPMNAQRRRKKAKRIAARDGGWYCWWCGCELSYDVPMNNKDRGPVRYPTIDHVEERGRGGSHDIDNLRLSCPPCNNNRSNGKK